MNAIDELGLENYELYYRSYIVNESCLVSNNSNLVIDKRGTLKSNDILELLDREFPKYKELPLLNTELAHELAHLAKRNNLAKEYNTLVLKSYFELGKDISDKGVLLDIAKEIGLDYELAKQTLETKCYIKQIISNKENALYKGIDEIPHLRVNIKNNYNKYLSKEEIKEVFSKVLNNNKKVEYCGEFCDF